MVGGRNRRPQVSPGGRQASIRSAFSSPVNTDQGLKEVQVRQFLRAGAQFSDGQRLLECSADRRLVLLLDPSQNQIHISGLQSLLRSSDYRAIHSVAMRIETAGQQERNRE